MVQNISLIKWSNSFPGIVAIVYRDNPTMVWYPFVGRIIFVVYANQLIWMSRENYTEEILTANTDPSSISTTLWFVWSGDMEFIRIT